LFEIDEVDEENRAYYAGIVGIAYSSHSELSYCIIILIAADTISILFC